MCDICYSSFSNAQELSEHRKTHANLIHAVECESGQLDPSRSAPASNDKLNVESSLDKKVPEQKLANRKEPQDEASTSSIFCNVCGKEVMSMEDTVGHQSAFHPDHKYKCLSPNCHFIYATISGRIKHMECKHEMTVKGGYLCTKCKAVFDTLDKKTAHNFFLWQQIACVNFVPKKLIQWSSKNMNIIVNKTTQFY